MRVPMGEDVMERNRLEEARKRAQIISYRIRQRADEAVRAKILAFAGELTGRPEDFGIDLVAWRYVDIVNIDVDAKQFQVRGSAAVNELGVQGGVNQIVAKAFCGRSCCRV